MWGVGAAMEQTLPLMDQARQAFDQALVLAQEWLLSPVCAADRGLSAGADCQSDRCATPHADVNARS